MSITDQLARLGELTAPSTLLPAVLAAVAGDQYGLMSDEPWPLWIAWNRDGIAAVMRADENDEDAFSGWFRKEFGRPLRRATAVPAALRRSRPSGCAPWSTATGRPVASTSTAGHSTWSASQ